MQTEIIVEEEGEEEVTIPTIPTGKRAAPTKEQVRLLIKEEVKKELDSTKKLFKGSTFGFKSLFDHPEYELKERLPLVKSEAQH